MWLSPSHQKNNNPPETVGFFIAYPIESIPYTQYLLTLGTRRRVDARINLIYFFTVISNQNTICILLQDRGSS